jgi:methylphosphotriester-DNA--protein-cysteine methyltransferase
MEGRCGRRCAVDNSIEIDATTRPPDGRVSGMGATAIEPARPAGSKATALSLRTMWTAFHRRDPRYDGRFVTAVRTTGIYCRPSCTCRKPRRENVRFYRSPAVAARAGYRPCKRCRPELIGGPAEAGRMMAREALAVMRARLEEPLRVRDLAEAVAMSVPHFARRFREADGRTPMRALADLRADRAQALLREDGMATLEVAFAAGFQSASAFTRAFRRRTGLGPAAWRRHTEGQSS